MKLTLDEYDAWTKRLYKKRQKLKREMEAWRRCEVVCDGMDNPNHSGSGNHIRGAGAEGAVNAD